MGKRRITQAASSASSTGSTAWNAPAHSILVQTVVLARDVSDLSGSYMNGSTNSRARGSMYSLDPNAGPWRLANVLSAVPKEASPETILVGVNDFVEVVAKNDDIDDPCVTPSTTEVSESDSSHLSNCEEDRVPVIIILMDPARKLYELMQIWVDANRDAVLDVLHAMQRRIPDTWKQAYDGLIQARGNRSNFSQLIHILKVDRYDVQPREIWIAKPWSMSARSTVEIADNLIRHLKNVGMLSQMTMGEGRGTIGRSSGTGAASDVPLTLTPEALKRFFLPQGVLRHHHACQFLSFRPSFEPTIHRHLLPPSQDLRIPLDENMSQISEIHSPSVASGVLRTVVSNGLSTASSVCPTNATQLASSPNLPQQGRNPIVRFWRSVSCKSCRSMSYVLENGNVDDSRHPSSTQNLHSSDVALPESAPHQPDDSCIREWRFSPKSREVLSIVSESMSESRMPLISHASIGSSTYL